MQIDLASQNHVWLQHAEIRSILLEAAEVADVSVDDIDKRISHETVTAIQNVVAKQLETCGNNIRWTLKVPGCVDNSLAYIDFLTGEFFVAQINDEISKAIEASRDRIFCLLVTAIAASRDMQRHTELTCRNAAIMHPMSPDEILETLEEESIKLLSEANERGPGVERDEAKFRDIPFRMLLVCSQYPEDRLLPVSKNQFTQVLLESLSGIAALSHMPKVSRAFALVELDRDKVEQKVVRLKKRAELVSVTHQINANIAKQSELEAKRHKLEEEISEE